MSLPFQHGVSRLLVATILAAATTLRAAIPAAEHLLPADTLTVLSVPDFSNFRAASRQSPQMIFWNSDAMAPFRAKLVNKITTEWIGPVEHDLGVKFADFAALPQGQLTLAVTLNSWNGGTETNPGIIFLLDARDQSALLQSTVTTLRQKWLDAGRPLRSETVHGIPFSVVTFTSNAIPPSLANVVHAPQPLQESGRPTQYPPAGELVFAQYQSLLIVANSLKAVEPVAAHLTGGGATPLAENPLFEADQVSQLRGSPTYYGWVNGKLLFDTIGSHATPPPNPDAPTPFPQVDPQAILKATGLAGLKSISFGVWESAEGELGTLHLNVPEAERAGVLKMLAFNPKEAGIPPFVPADAVKFYRVRLDGRQLWAELQKVVAGVSPQGLATLNSVIDVANTMAQGKTPGFDLRTALIGNLGDDIIGYEKLPTDQTVTGLASPPAVFLLAVMNPDQVIDAIQTVAGMSTPQASAPAPRDFLGHKIFTLNRRGPADPNTGETKSLPLYVAASGGYVAFSADAAMIEEYLRSGGGTGKSLRNADGLAAAAQHVGGTGGGMFGYTNQREALRTFFQLMKASAPVNGSPVVANLPFAFSDWFDFSLLPDYGVVSKYFGISVVGGVVNSEGATIKMFSPRPPGLH